MRRTVFRNFTPFRESRGLRPSEKTSGGRVFRGVTIIRAGLGNRRDMNFYPEGALKEASEGGKFEGLKAYADHPTSVDEQIQPERTVRDFVGLYSNTKYKEGQGGKPGRVVGDLRIFRAHRWLSDVVDELVEIGQADKIGISINGNGRTERQRVREAGEELEANVVSKFLTLRSADVVTEAGAGGGFQQILESARGASKENTMGRKQIMKALREAADAGDTEKVKKLTADLEEADEAEAADEPAARGGKKKDAKGKKKPAAKVEESEGDEADEADADEDDDEVDHEEELERAVEEARDEADVDADEEDDDAEDGDEGDDLDESDEGDDDTEDGESDLEECAECGGTCTGDHEEGNGQRAKQTRGAVDKLKRHAATSKTREAWPPAGGKKKKNLNGVPSKGKGKFNKVNNPNPVKGRKFGEKDTTERPSISGRNRIALMHENNRLRRRNNRLAEALRAQGKINLARKLLKESEIPAELRAPLVGRLVKTCENEKQMRGEIDFQQRLLESAANRAVESFGDEGFDEVEGAGSRFRESFGGSGGGEGDDDEFINLFRESDVPLKAKK